MKVHVDVETISNLVWIDVRSGDVDISSVARSFCRLISHEASDAKNLSSINDTRYR